MPRVLVLVPTYNEYENIAPLFGQIWNALPSAHILVIDDNSKDNTQQEVLKQKSLKEDQVFLLQRPGKLGLGKAYIAGFKWGLDRGYEILIQMDADLSHDAQLIPKMVRTLKSEAIACGSRYVAGGGTENWSWLRLMISRWGSFYARNILGMKARDLTGGFNAWKRDVLLEIDLDQIASEGYGFQIELKYRAFLKGFNMVELPFIFKERRAGHSKMSAGIVLEAMYKVIILRLTLS